MRFARNVRPRCVHGRRSCTRRNHVRVGRRPVLPHLGARFRAADFCKRLHDSVATRAQGNASEACARHGRKSVRRHLLSSQRTACRTSQTRLSAGDQRIPRTPLHSAGDRSGGKPLTIDVPSFVRSLDLSGKSLEENSSLTYTKSNTEKP